MQVKKWPAIKDERRVKRPMPPFVQFTLNRHASGDFKRMKLPDASKLIGQEWKALSSDEKKVSLSPQSYFYLLALRY